MAIPVPDYHDTREEFHGLGSRAMDDPAAPWLRKFDDCDSFGEN
ncbi:hypothetical protein ANO14919_050070 [Xylariales sp. No.14919]|nr:hypothetical protein ANO14919_050070 [Xylariales sp. No.14919]